MNIRYDDYMKEFLTERETEFLLENETRVLTFPGNRAQPITTMRFIWQSYDCILEIGDYTQSELLETIWTHARNNKVDLAQATYDVVSVFDMMSAEIYADEEGHPKDNQYWKIKSGVHLRGKRLIPVGYYRVSLD